MEILNTNSDKIEPKPCFGSRFDYVDFDNMSGLLSAHTEHECTEISLSNTETKQLFLSMLNYFLCNGDRFWEYQKSEQKESE